MKKERTMKNGKEKSMIKKPIIIESNYIYNTIHGNKIENKIKAKGGEVGRV